MTGRAVLVGAGPGDPDLLTVRAARELERADVVLYDALISSGILALIPEGCEKIDVGKRGDGGSGVAQAEIAARMIELARAGRHVVRLKGGDPFVFGRGGEEATALVEAGIPFEVVPGVSASIAVPAYAGIPVTDRRLSSSFTVVTGHRGKNIEDERTDWEGLARSSETLIVLMGTAWLPNIAERVIAGGREPETPAAVISCGTTGRQRTVCAPLRELAARALEARITPPAIVVIGEVVRFRESLRWYERRPLFGKRVLLLRAHEDQAEIAAELASRGATPVSVPLLQFLAAADVRPLERALEGVKELDWLVFTSATAVRFCAERLAELLHSAGSSRPRVACIGAATARVAARHHLPVDVVPAGGELPDALVKEMLPLESAQILIPRSDHARDALPRALRAQGATVQCVTAYRNAVPQGAAADLTRAIEEGVDAVFLTSPSTVDRLAVLLGPSGMSRLAQRAALVCIGTTTKAALGDHQLEPTCVAVGNSGHGMVEALERYHRAL